MTAALEGGEWSAARIGRTLPPGKTRYPFYGRLGEPQDRSGRAENLVPTGIRSRTVQPVVSRYTDWATRPTYIHIYTHIYMCLCLTFSKRNYVAIKMYAGKASPADVNRSKRWHQLKKKHVININWFSNNLRLSTSTSDNKVFEL